MVREFSRTVDVNEAFVNRHFNTLSRFNDPVGKRIDDCFTHCVHRNFRKLFPFQASVKFHAPVHRVRHILHRFVPQCKNGACIPLYVIEGKPLIRRKFGHLQFIDAAIHKQGRACIQKPLPFNQFQFRQYILRLVIIQRDPSNLPGLTQIIRKYVFVNIPNGIFRRLRFPRIDTVLPLMQHFIVLVLIHYYIFISNSDTRDPVSQIGPLFPFKLNMKDSALSIIHFFNHRINCRLYVGADSLAHIPGG